MFGGFKTFFNFVCNKCLSFMCLMFNSKCSTFRISKFPMSHVQVSKFLISKVFVFNFLFLASVIYFLWLKLILTKMTKSCEALAVFSVSWLDRLDMMRLLACGFLSRTVMTSSTYGDRLFVYERNNVPPLPAHYDFDSDTSGNSD